MKILLLHCDYIRFKPVKKAIKEPEELGKEGKEEKSIEDVLVVFTAVEASDSENIVEEYVKNVKDVFNQVKARNIVIYPYAHLSSNLGKPEIALEIMKSAEDRLIKEKYRVVRAPFGYYKEFELKCKGHPLAELSREIGGGREGEGGREKAGTVNKIIEEKYDPEKLLRQISKTRLDTAKLKENDHRILGQKLDLFSFNEVAPGMVFWHNNGLIVYNELAEFWRQMHRKASYGEISTPQILDKKLWQISGHWEKYKENIFLTEYEKRQFAVKPMNCPGGILVFKSRPRSYKELPMKVAELGIVHRQELSGVLSGLFRVIKFTQDDAHIYCKEEQLEKEIGEIISLVDLFYKKFNLPYHVELSTRPEKRIGDEKLWDKAEKILENVLKKKKIDYKLNKGDGAFYGPKIDFHVKDSLGRTWQCGTIQLDFAMPDRFDIEFIDEDNKPKRPVMLHRTVLGSFERFIGILLEHLNGNLPTWLNPIQVKVVSFTERNVSSAEKITETLRKEGVRVETDFRDSTVDYKVRDAEIQRVPYIIVIGDKEEKSNTIAVRSKGKKPEFGVKLDMFTEKIKKEIKERT